VTVLQILDKSTAFLKQKGVESPRLNAELLICDFLKCRRLDLYLNFDKPVDGAQTDQLRERVLRRGRFEPLQYITGTCEFYGLTLEVNPSVLIPRPETELLVEKMLEEKPSGSLLDLGTGSGAIALAMKKNLPSLEMTGSDVSGTALDAAKRNGEKTGVSVRWIQADLFENLKTFDAIVSNPPYVKRGDLSALQAEVRDHEPTLALDGGEDGLDFYRRMLPEALKHLNPAGRIFLECGQGQAKAVAALGQENGLVIREIRNDLSGIERILVFQS
jgi:release factor glutamine methyltransferase